MNLTIAVISLGIEVIIVIASVVWAVGKIKATTEVLAITINGLKAAIDKLDLSIEKIFTKQFEHENRITILEQKHINV